MNIIQNLPDPTKSSMLELFTGIHKVSNVFFLKKNIILFLIYYTIFNYSRAYIRWCIYMYVYMCVCLCACMYVYVHTYIRMYGHFFFLRGARIFFDVFFLRVPLTLKPFLRVARARSLL